MYDHTQPGHIILLTVGGSALICFYVALYGGVPRPPQIVLLATGAILALALLFFYSLRVVIVGQTLRLSFGVGVIKKAFDLSDAVSAAVVENSWACGWGIHWCGDSTLYNVSGWYAVEITFANERKIRVGSDEPDRLHHALLAVIGQNKNGV